MGPIFTLVLSPIRMNVIKPAASLLKGRGSDETHVTQTQEITNQRTVLVASLTGFTPAPTE